MRTAKVELHLFTNVSPDGFTINAFLEQFEELLRATVKEI